MNSFPVICGIIFILNGVIQFWRREYIPGTIWVILGILSLVTQNIREFDNFQFGNLKQLSLKAIAFGMALTIAASLFVYQIYQDYNAKQNLNTSRAEEIQPRK
ncbi:hypothetical protein H6G54_07885 [Anabaena cylindrica FACHB-243]|uniref:Uncharacterized protein n=1 Tax=Anabaena cylindrica (strain ATCC 27899 / PCC 7122) TaxID=272123 RepID=K9ZL12_ANACC|nr:MULTISPECIES: hypothetical protein [Anabaena]AFZ59469.1 hypothetical protein Anacy_4101 [Anabaena cylindrica PCC 7122]MBD2417624.1 hypothetical protein [Anabaena cylindrica FACHB-243]MBY5283184.1 hypothetical protein [Anabaena sp. CCAP 1446/1C]MBY5308627.1 hypothetical protein [Anabaena sp. CCAP 1446/1C]MCM2405385.1 hypothetical protein [Anabaena sp. CCAP 1446/1C]